MLLCQFISHLATTDRELASSAQNHTLNAIVFLYKRVLNIELRDFGQMERAKKPEKLPTVMARKEVNQVFSSMSGINQLMGRSGKKAVFSGLSLINLYGNQAKNNNHAKPPGTRRSFDEEIFLFLANSIFAVKLKDNGVF